MQIYDSKSSMKSFFIFIIIHADWILKKNTFSKNHENNIEFRLTHAFCHFMLWFEISFGGRNILSIMFGIEIPIAHAMYPSKATKIYIIVTS